MKYRIKESKVIHNWGFAYSARTCYDVQKKILFFFWITIKGFWDKEYAESYLKALNEMS